MKPLQATNKIISSDVSRLDEIDSFEDERLKGVPPIELPFENLDTHNRIDPEWKISDWISSELEVNNVPNTLRDAFVVYLARLTNRDELLLGWCELEKESSTKASKSMAIDTYVLTMVIKVNLDEPWESVSRFIDEELKLHRRSPTSDLDTTSRKSRVPRIVLSTVTDPHSNNETALGQLLTLQISPRGTFRWIYDKIRLNAEVIHRMTEHLRILLRSFRKNGENIPVGKLDLLPENERDLLLREWNKVEQKFPERFCLHQLFEQHVSKTPDATAIVYEDEVVTYSELNIRANRLAHHLVHLGVVPDDLVAICVSRSTAMTVAMVAVLKSGGAYVPLDPSYPCKRLGVILGEVAPKILLVDQLGRSALGEFDFTGITLLDPNDTINDAPSNPEIRNLTVRHLAYVTFTSGSTGIPKGVMVEHRNILRMFSATESWFHFDHNDTWCLFHSPSFDVAVWELWGALRYGGRLIVVPYAVVCSPQDTHRYICKYGITVLNQTPNVFKAFASCYAKNPSPDRLRLVLFTGEPLDPRILQAWYAVRDDSSPLLVNMYGITETTVHATYKPLNRDDGNRTYMSIGKRVPDLTFYLLDAHRQPVPLGAVGEIYIGGAGITRGYLNREKLTEERFVPDPFDSEPGARLYKTGDLARYLSDGDLVFLCRDDFQVKVRGFRIEPGEIEACLTEHPDVRQALVTAKGDEDDKRLVAYIVTDANESLAQDLYQRVSANLPEYMIPSAFVQIRAFPLTVNGKVDRKALPEPDVDSFARPAYSEPQGQMERLLASIWSQLLDIDKISRFDSFFALGGYSLLAGRLIGRIAALGVNLPTNSLVLTSTLSELAKVIETQLKSGVNHVPPLIKPVRKTNELPLSFAQKRLWFIARLSNAENSALRRVYNMSMKLHFQGRLDIIAWKRALDAVFVRHEALRTVFASIDGEPRIRVLETVSEMPFREHDLRGVPNVCAELDDICREEAQQTFDLETGPLIRARLLRLKHDEWIFLLTQHHIVSDGWSIDIMMRELTKLYEAFSSGRVDPLPPMEIQYSDYAVWQRECLSTEGVASQSDYWRNTLDGAPVSLNVPTDRSRPPIQSYDADFVPVFLDAELTNALRDLSKKHSVTMYMTILAGWATVLARLSSQDDIVIGTPFANRAHPQIEDVIGFFVNMLALRLDLSESPTAIELLSRVRRTVIEAQDHQDLPFEHVVEIIQPERSLSRAPIFQVMLAWQNDELHELVLRDVRITPEDPYIDTIRYDLELNLMEMGGNITGTLGFAKALFDRETIVRHVGYLEAVLRGMVNHSLEPVDKIDILSQAERTMLLERFNSYGITSNDHACVHELFEYQVRKNPEALAVVCDDEVWTYSELNKRANRLAHELLGLGVVPNQFVILSAMRSLALVAGFLAVLKAGGAYVPLDPNHPGERFHRILNDVNPNVILVDRTGRSAIGEDIAKTLKIVDLGKNLDNPESNPTQSGVTCRNMVYVTYTSGSTGMPKGVMVEHRNLVSIVMRHVEEFDIRPGDRIPQFAAMAFDISIAEITRALGTGSTLYVPADTVRKDPHKLWEYIGKHELTHAHITPSMIRGCESFPDIRNVPTLVMEAEPLNPHMIRSMRHRSKLYNGYGLSETTSAVTSWYCDRDCASDAVPIGRPLPDTRLYILDKYGHPVPFGSVGEVCLGGLCVARGYLNRPELTEIQFRADSFSDAFENRLYKTGDLGRYRSDANVVFVGRNDYQVKIRGNRIELGEIESALKYHRSVREAVVIAVEIENEQRLIAYLIGDSIDEFARTMRLHLLSRLPHYMIPFAFVRLDKFPLSTNGKLDRRALPKPDENAIPRETYEAPKTGVESILESVWKELLKVDRISRYDSFFALGGHSLLAVRVINQMAAHGVELSLSDLFEANSLAQLSEKISCRQQTELTFVPTVRPVPRDDAIPLSFTQERMWFFAQLDKSATSYHIPVKLRLRGLLQLSTWQRALDVLISRHEILRSIFVTIENQPKVRFHPEDISFPLHVSDLSNESDVESALDKILDEEIHKRFELDQGPLIRACLVKLSPKEHIFLLDQHHIVSDGWSIDLMLRELSLLYSSFVQGQPNPLKPLSVQYYDYAQWQRELVTSDHIRIQSKYWRETLSDAPILLELPTNRPRPRQQSHDGDSVPIVIDAELTASLNEFSRQRGVTLYITILTAWASVLSRLSGQDDLVIGTPVSNRTRKEIEDLVGCFVNTLALRIDLSGSPTVNELLTRVRQVALAAQDHQDLPFEHVVEIVQPLRNLSHTPIFQVFFGWRSIQSEALSFPQLEVSIEDLTYDSVVFDIELDLKETGGLVYGNVNFASALFDRVTITRHAEYLIATLSAMVNNDQQPVKRIEIIAPAERTLLLETLNDTEKSFPDHLCIHQIFEQRVHESPESLAVGSEKEHLTYAQLNVRANVIANLLIKSGLNPEGLVAVCVPPSPTLIISILAVLKAGGTYVPFDPIYSSERIVNIFNDAKPAFVLADIAGQSVLGKNILDSITLIDPTAKYDSSETNPRLPCLTSRHLVQVIYTSGSTGKPKGVMIEHRAVVNRILALIEEFNVEASSRVLQLISFAFDAGFWEILWALLSGASLHIPPGSVRRDPRSLWTYIANHEITHAICIPSLLQDAPVPPPFKRPLTIAVGSEPVSAAVVQKLRDHMRISHDYGPTESVMAATGWRVPSDHSGKTLPIGRPFANTRVYLLDSYGKPVPFGTIGEMYVGGVSLARGYLNRPDLTEKRFSEDPFVDRPEARIYQTGDLARYLPDGNLLFVGRTDDQLKIRGFRIEPGEIEACLMTHHAVRNAIVLPFGNKPVQRLVAYVICDQIENLVQTLRTHVVARLPEYMVPSAFVSLEKFPTLSNGKLNRRALPEPDQESFVRQIYEAPENEVELALAKVWAQLLGVEQISRNDSFFELGGHSIIGVRMLEQLRNLGFEVAVHDLFESPILWKLAERLEQRQELFVPPNVVVPDTTKLTPDMFPLIDLNQNDIDAIVFRVSGGLVNIQDIYALSPLQDGILFHHLLPNRGDLYVISTFKTYSNRSEVDKYLQAAQKMVNRHDILRTCFVWKGLSVPAQVVLRRASLIVEEPELELNSSSVDDQLRELYDPLIYRMDLGKAPLLRYVIAKRENGEWILLQLMHHLIGDHDSLDFMNDEIHSHISGQSHGLSPSTPFRNYIAEVRKKEGRDDHVGFFTEMLAEISEPTLPFGLVEVRHDGSRFGRTEMTLSTKLNGYAREQAKRSGVSLATLCHLAYGQVISRATSRDRIVFGTVLSGRLKSGIGGHNALGVFINTLPIRIDIDDTPVQVCIRTVQNRLASLLKHDFASLTLAQRCSSVPSGTPLFSALLNYRHNVISTLEPIGFEAFGVGESTNYSITLSVEDSESSLGFSSMVMEPVAPEMLCAHTRQALESLVETLKIETSKPICLLEVLPKTERLTLMETFNATRVPFPEHLCIHQLFEEQVMKTPENIALFSEGNTLTYTELNVRANRLAHQLVKLGVKPDERVVVCVKRSIATIVGVLAIQKAGGAYVPLDPSYPSKRLTQILIDATPKVVLADQTGREVLDESTLASMTVIDPNVMPDESTTNPKVPTLTSRNLAYVIFTSGSTGVPKGVMVEHRGLVNLIRAQISLFDVKSSSRLLQFVSISFDVSAAEIMMALNTGAALYLPTDLVRKDPHQLWNYIDKHEITHVCLTPAVLRDHATLPELRTVPRVILSGEPPNPRMVHNLSNRVELFNSYGPTEATINVTALKFHANFTDQIISMGRVYPNTRLYVLNDHGQPVPIGVIGELYIGGVNVARGYLNEPDLTAERFVHDPFSGSVGDRLFKTGDLVRYLPDGNLVYVGRNDQQVKIRGFRIEPGEIEACLASHPDVRAAIVSTFGDIGHERLIAHVLAEKNVDLARTLRTYSVSKLPDYMVPSAFVRLDEWPLTPNGKIDRQALPPPDDKSLARQHFEAPRGNIEETLASIWQELLEVNQISRNDSFFALGGHSLLAVRMISRLAAANMKLPLSVIFESKSLAEIAQAISSDSDIIETAEPTLKRLSRDGDLLLSFAQQRLWFSIQLEVSGKIYKIPMAFRFRGHMNVKAWRQALDTIYSRHEAVRSVFVSVDGEPRVRLIDHKSKFPLIEHDLRQAADSKTALTEIIENENHQSFDLERGPLIRAHLIKLKDDEHVFLLTQHHIVSDGWSIGILLRELSILYESFLREKPNPLDSIDVQYPDYAAWQREWLSKDRIRIESAFWFQTLSDAPVLLELPTDRPRPSQQSYDGDLVQMVLDRDLTASLVNLSRQNGATLFMTILAAWASVLSKLSGQFDLVIGTPCANRRQKQIENLIGFFVNMLALRVDLSGSPTFVELLAQVRQIAITAQEHQDLPFEHVVDVIKPPRSSAHSPIFQVTFTWNNDKEGQLILPGLEVSHEDFGRDTAIYDLQLSLSLTNDKVVGSLGFATALFDQKTIQRYVSYLYSTLRSIVVDSHQLIGTIDILSPTERDSLLSLWKADVAPFPDQSCIHQLFEQRAIENPEAIAVVFEDETYTYAELNSRANKLARRLVELGVVPDQLVVICVSASPAMVIAILAILKAGGAYVPLDPIYSSQRIGQIFNDAASTLVVADGNGRDVLGDDNLAEHIVIDPNESQNYSDENPQIAGLTSRHLAYVIYTSGSTGIPKGVMIEHRSIVNYTTAIINLLGSTPNSRVLQACSIGFDVSVGEIMMALCSGATLDIPIGVVRMDPKSLLNYVVDHAVTQLSLGPSFLRDVDFPSTLTHRPVLKIGGERSSPALVQKLRNHVRLCNAYGPTECTVGTTLWFCPPDYNGETVPIGRPMPNTRHFILDPYGEPVPMGAVGELYIGGVIVARGYLNRPELTAERFCTDKFTNDPDSRLYRTGDLARYLPDGTICYLGRNDEQVKVRGFRIEPDEIEACLASHPAVRESVVVANKDDGNERLIAYVISDEIENLAQTLRTYVSERLPEYMVPSAYVRIDKIPTTTNDKLDRKALPAPDDNAVVRLPYEAPQGAIETMLAASWSELLDVGNISRHDSFFALGGHSLLVVRMLSRVNALGVRIPLSALYSSSSLANLARDISQQLEGDAAALPAIKTIPRDTDLPLSFAQQRLWFISQIIGETGVYNLPLAFRIRGPLNVTAFHRALDRIYARHEALRSVFVSVSGEPRVRLLDPSTGPPFIEHDLRGDPRVAETLDRLGKDEAYEPFDLETGPLIRARLVRVNDDERVFFLTQHHIVSDGWSVGILMRELNVIYAALLANEPEALPDIQIQYPDYAAWQRQWLSAHRLQRHIDYWRVTLADAPIVHDLPTDRPRPSRQSHDAGSVPVVLDAVLTESLRSLSKRYGTTLFMTILTAWASVLSRLSNQNDLVIGTPCANRTRQEVENLIGFFVNMLALRIDLSNDPSVKELLARVRQVSIEAQEHQDIPFEHVVEIVQPERSLAHAPIFQIVFNWQNNETNPIELHDLDVSSYDQLADDIKVDLVLHLTEMDHEIVGSITHATAMFNETTISRYVGYLQTTLREMANEPSQLMTNINIISSTERQLFLGTWNATDVPFPDQLCIHQLFEHQVSKTSHSTALVSQDSTLTYAELNSRANYLAHRLIRLGVRPDQLVVICVERSAAMIIGMLAILKSGGAYVPLDPSYSSQRLIHIFDQAVDSVILADEIGIKALGSETLARFTVIDPNKLDDQIIDNPEIAELTSRHLAYVMFTSGSTGVPKGVMIEHHGVVNLILAATKACNLSASSRVLQFISIGFDASAMEIFGALSCGAILDIPTDDVRRDPSNFWTYVKLHSVTYAMLAPSFLRNAEPPPMMDIVPTIILGAEIIGVELVRKLSHRVKVVIVYGVTECTIFNTIWMPLSDIDIDEIPIGHRVDNTRLYILDANDRLAPIGAAGEICIGGVGVARGYLNLPDQTAVKFQPDPFVDAPEAKIYRTGDLGRCFSDGHIVYVGRIDDEVKIRGCRVEPGEIELCLTSYPGIREAIVIAIADERDKKLIAYVVADPIDDLSKTLRMHIRTKLPEYMIPAAIMRIDAIPMTAHGKLDRRALPIPDEEAFAREEYEPPMGNVEVTLAATWSELLGVERIGRLDNFFALGGHSLLAVQLKHLATSRGIFFDLYDVLQYPVLADLALKITRDQLSRPPTSATPVPIRSKGSQPSLFFLPAGHGEFAYAFSLSRSISSDYMMYGLPWPFDEDPTISTMEELASKMVGIMKTVQQTGPYRVCGYSSGGVLAYAIAKQLRDTNEAIHSVILIDSRAPSFFQKRHYNDKMVLYMELLEESKNTRAGEIKSLCDKFDELGVMEFIRASKKLGLYSHVRCFDSKAREIEQMLKYSRLMLNYVPERSTVPVYQLYCTETIPLESNPVTPAESSSSSEDFSLGWNRIVSSNDLRITAIPGNHKTMMSDANNRQILCDAIDDILKL